jgi:hypothetical protein
MLILNNYQWGLFAFGWAILFIIAVASKARTIENGEKK